MVRCMYLDWRPQQRQEVVAVGIARFGIAVVVAASMAVVAVVVSEVVVAVVVAAVVVVGWQSHVVCHREGCYLQGPLGCFVVVAAVVVGS